MTTPTDPAENAPAPQETPPPASTPSAKTKRTRREKWRRRFFVFVTLLVLIGLGSRVLLHVLFPTVLNRVANIYGLEAKYDRLDLSVLGADVGIWGLRVTPIDGDTPILQADYVRGNISTLKLLKLQLHVKRAEAENAELVVERLADGTLPLVERLLGTKTPAATPSASKAGEPTLDPPLSIDALRLQNAKARFRDQMVTPATDVTMQLDLLVRGIGAPDRETLVDLQLHSPETLAALYVTAAGTSRDNRLDATFDLQMVGLNLEPTQAYLAPLGIHPRSQDIAATAKGTLEASLVGVESATATTASSTRPAAGTLQASLSLREIQLKADAAPAAGVKAVELRAREVSPGALRFDEIRVEGVHGRAGRTTDGLLAFAGIELGAAGQTPSPTTRPASATAPPAVATSAALPILEIDRLAIRDVDLAFVDAAVTPANHLSLNMPELLIEHFSTDPARAGTPARLTLQAGSPAIAESISVTGDIAAATATKTLSLNVSIADLSADAIAPYLRAVGLAESFDAATFSCRIDGRLTPTDEAVSGGIEISDIRLADGGVALLDMPRVAIRDASIRPGVIRFDDIELVGPILPIRRETSGRIHLLGLHTDASARPSQTTAIATTPPPGQPPATTPVDPPAAPATQSAAPALPTLEIGKFTWRGARIQIDDEAAGPEPISLVLDDITASAELLTFGPATGDKPGEVRFALRAPGLVDAIDVSGKLTPSADATSFEATIDSKGITLERVRPLLALVNLEPTFQAGGFEACIAGSARLADRAIHASLFARDARLTDGDHEWLGTTHASLRGIYFDGSLFGIDAIQVDEPRLLVRRDAEGRIEAAGVKLLPAPPQPRAVVVADDAPAVETRVDLSLPIVATLGQINISSARLRIEDAYVLPAATLDMTADASLHALTLGAPTSPAAFRASLSGPGLVGQARVHGQLLLSPASQGLQATLDARGLSGTAIEPYLPPNIALDLQGRRARGTILATLAHDERGGSNLSLELTNVALENDEQVDAGIDALRIKASRIDLPAGQIAIDELAVESAVLNVTQDDAGLHVGGITLASTPRRETRPSAPAAEAIASEAASDVGALVRRSAESLPLISIESLSLGAKEVSFRSSALGEPIAIRDATVKNVAGPIRLGGDRPEDHPAARIQATLALSPLVKRIEAQTTLAPFAVEPTASVSIDADGINGPAVTQLLPSLADLLDGDDLADGRFTTSMESRFRFTRRGPLGIDLTRDITADFTIHQTRLFAGDLPEPLLAVEEVRGDKIRFSPATGSLVVGALEVTKPAASVVRDADGIHVGGLTLKVLQPAPPSTTVPTGEPTSAIVAAADKPETPPAPDPSPATPETTKPGGEVRIDRLTVNGVAFRVEDRVNTPHTVLPVTDLDVEVVGLSTRALAEPRPIRFSAIVSAGEVPLPPRKPKAGVESEDRAVFAEASANGNLTIFPKPGGYIRASISGLEMTALRGIASEFGITLGGGTFDGRLDVRMKSADTFEAKAWPTFNELRMSEVPNGRIQSTFRLPAPPDVVISTLEDVDGSLTFPITVPIEAGNVKVGAIIGSAIGSVGKVLAEAMIAAPLKAAKLGAGLLGLDTSGGRGQPIDPVVIEFTRGESQLSPRQLVLLQQVRAMMAGDPTLEVTLQHELGENDVAIADERVNLAVDDSEAIAARLMARKRELQRDYADQSAEMLVTLAGRDDAAIESAGERLRATAVALKETEDGLDSIFDLLRPGADRQSVRRTKAAAILLADLRLRSVQDWLQASGLRDAENRVRRTNALFNPRESGPGRVRLVLTRRAKT